MKKKCLLMLSIALIFSILVSACGSSYSASKENRSDQKAAEYAEEEYEGAAYPESYEEPAEAPEAEPVGGDGNSAYTAEQDSGAAEISSDKLVYTCNLEIETTEYEETLKAIRNKIREYGAIIEYESESDSDRQWYYSGHTKSSGTMRLSMTVRVPTAKYDAFVTDAGTFGKLTSKSQNVENISRQYRSTEARIEALTKEEERLKEMLDKAETIEEMIMVEDRLTDVEAELNSYRTQLASMDIDVAYSTVNINVREVLVYTPEEVPTITFGQRIARAVKESWSGFRDFLEGLLIVIIHLFPFLLLGLVIALLVIFLNKAADKRNPERKQRREQAKQAKKEEKERKRNLKRGYYTMNPPVGPRPGKEPGAPAGAVKAAPAAEVENEAAAVPEAESRGPAAADEIKK